MFTSTEELRQAGMEAYEATRQLIARAKAAGALRPEIEEGDLALVKATPDTFTELARVPALTGKTWNHPVVVGDLLLARNAEQMAAFRLPTAP